MTQVESFDDVALQKIALVEFFTTWCGPCKIQKSILQDVEACNSDVFVATVDVENSPALADAMKVRSVPTTILFENGKEKGRLNGLQQRDRVESLIGLAVPA